MKRILIIEDEEDIAALERDYLTINGYDVVIEPNGMEGLRLAQNGDGGEAWSLIILDLMLPGLDGFSVLRTLREQSNTPVLILSARSNEIDKVRGLGLGADDYMQKPFSPAELVARVRAHIARYERLTAGQNGEESNIIEALGLSIDRDTRRVTVNGAEKNLTPKEYDILLFLAESQGRVYSKEDLFEKIWGLEAMGDTGTVIVHIRKLREKIEPDPQNPSFIETVWGVGYRFRP